MGTLKKIPYAVPYAVTPVQTGQELTLTGNNGEEPPPESGRRNSLQGNDFGDDCRPLTATDKMPPPRFERGTFGLGNRRSILLSYEGKHEFRSDDSKGRCGESLRREMPPCGHMPGHSSNCRDRVMGVWSLDRKKLKNCVLA